MIGRTLAAGGLLLVLTGCASHRTVYTRPAAVTPPAFKENADWKPAEPKDAAVRGAWWELFGDPQLNELEGRVSVSNQTLRAIDAQFAQARALLRVSQSARYPQLGATPAVSGLQPSGNRAVSSFHESYGDYLAPVSASYEADVWGRIHNTVESSRALAQASAADLESARLSVYSELAVDYFTLHGLDSLSDLLENAVTAYQRALDLTESRFRGGIASQADVAFAETQLETTRAQAVDIRAQRAQVEHAIAVLVGAPASSFSIPHAPLALAPPGVPAGIPSDLLERRPDIAASERRVASATAQVGVATAAYYPLLNLTGSVGFESSSIGSLLAGASNFWAIGPSAVASVFDAGRRRAQADQARAALEQASASYQSSVLTAFREVEDQLATLRVLEEEATVQDRAVAAADRSLTLATNRYRGGVVSYLEVITAQSALLTNQRAAVGLLIRRMASTVLLLKAIGGGWSSSTIPTLVAERPQH